MIVHVRAKFTSLLDLMRVFGANELHLYFVFGFCFLHCGNNTTCEVSIRNKFVERSW